MQGKQGESAASTGLLVLGMHRSGASALARVLQLGGADLGAAGAGKSKQSATLDDSFALELHERLLARFGRRWDDVAALPAGALREAGKLGAEPVGEYLRGNRAANPVWALKEAGLCALGGIWREQASGAGMPLGAIVVVRHPLEVAASLDARDGIGRGRALLLWLRYTVGALQVADGLPTIVVSYEQLLGDWRTVTTRIGELPGATHLRWDAKAQAAIDGYLEQARHHHRAGLDEASLPTLAADLWHALSDCAREGTSPQGLGPRFAAALARECELIDPLVADFRVLEGNERVAALEAELAAVRARLASSQKHAEQARSEVRALRVEEDRLKRVMGTRSWRWTRPARVLARALGGNWSADDTREIRKAWQRLGGVRPAEMLLAKDSSVQLPAPVRRPENLADAQPGLPDVFVWAVIDWDFRFQRPQHLAKAMAQRGHRTFYISNNFVDSEHPGCRIDPLDDSGRLFQVQLNLHGAPEIYYGLPSEAQVEALRASLATLLLVAETAASLSVVQHPYWLPMARATPNARVVYDCMDHHAGFENNATTVLAAERKLLGDSDLVIVTSLWLQHEVESSARACALVRNACEYEFFSEVPAERYRDPQRRKVIGYFGAIAEWFDLDLLRKVARAHPEALVLLVGSDTVGARETLADVRNIRFVGEVPYAGLPYWLHCFDVALLPFRVIPLTLATNPVKVYEYLAAGKPVVAVDLPEMAQFGNLVHAAKDAQDFIDAVGTALDEPAGAGADARRAFAAGQTWAHRARAIDEAIDAIEEARVSVVVLTYNNLALSQECLRSIEEYSDYPNLEVIVVDNASSDGSREWLDAWQQEPSAAGHVRRLILNDDNLGFSAGNNVGLRAASGDYLIVLNNDTHVTPGWVRTLLAHFRRDPDLGLLGPVTNNIGNEARIAISYEDMDGMIAAAGEYTRAHPGESLRMDTAAFFCVAMPRRVYEAVGDMDEQFGVGFFEDDDYCRRIAQAGFSIACAEDVFVHHRLSASFDALGAERKRELFERNKAIYEAKWGKWIPHQYRESKA